MKGYIWRADGESCPVCAPRDGKIFTWGEGEAPGSIHPNCNCFAEPVAEGAGDSTPPRITGADIADMALLLASLIPAVRASRIGSAAVRGLGRVGQRVLDRARGNEKPPEAPKPAAKPQTLQEILNPEGKPIGRSGGKPKVREMDGGDKAAKDLYERLSKGGTPYKPPGYPPEAQGTKLPNGDWVGYRPDSKSGPPTVDIHVKDTPFDKIKFP